MVKRTDKTDESTTPTEEPTQAEGTTTQPEQPRIAATPTRPTTAQTKTLTNHEGREVRTNMNVER